MKDARILVIDDERDTLELVQTVLEEGGFGVLLAENGEQGLEIIRGEHPDIVITDVVMPKMDGFELVRRLRSDPVVGTTPLLILSARQEEEDKVKGLDLGADDYMTKPFGRKELLARARAMIRRRDLLREGVAPIPQGPFAREGLEQLANYTFDSFLVGVGNRTAYEGAKAVAESPGRRFNPIFLHGGPGLGKTHLMCALANEAYERNTGITILYLTAEIFSQQILDAYEQRRVGELKQKYENMDLLLIDDIQFLAISPSLQAVAADILSGMYDRGKQIVISSDRKPEDLPAIADEISSGLTIGLVVRVDRPDASLRSRILRFKAEQRNWAIDSDLLDYLASKLECDIRTLDGVAKRLVAMETLGGVQPDKRMIDRLVLEVIEADQQEFGLLEISPPQPTATEDLSASTTTEPGEDVQLIPSLAIEFAQGQPVTKVSGLAEEVAVAIPRTEATSLVVLGTSSVLVTDTVDSLVGGEEGGSPLPEGDGWAYMIHAKTEEPRWVVLGTSGWDEESELAQALGIEQSPSFLVILDGKSPEIFSARRLLSGLPKEKILAVVVLIAAVQPGTPGVTKELLARSMRRLFKVPQEVPLIVAGGVNTVESRGWVERALL